MMTKIKFNFYYIVLLFFIFPVYSAQVFAAVTAASGATTESANSANTANINDLDISNDSDEISPPAISLGARKIPDSIVSLSSGYAIIVDKKYQRIYVFHKDGAFYKVFEAPCSTGKHSGSKWLEGDAKTPNGIFFTTKILQNPGPPETYGSMAFPLDYPTISDQRIGRNGNNIWIHGTTKSLLPKQSKGCVVLHDRDLKRLANFIYLNRTPVIISESIKWVPQNYVLPSKNELEKILISWNKAFTEKDINKIDSLYMHGSEIKGKRRQELYKKIGQMKFSNRHFAMEPRDISILQEGSNAVIIFDQIYAVNDNNFQGFYNKLILEKTDNKWYIVDDATTPNIAARKLARVEIEQKDTDQSDHKEIRNLVNKWLTGWKSGDMKIYRECYASDFQSREMGLDAWIAHKTNVRETSKNIKISIENLVISANEDSAKATFTQHYSSSRLMSKGKKTLELKKIGDEWKIYREIM
jgi:murein L,D-transpeptidase YafK